MLRLARLFNPHLIAAAASLAVPCAAFLERYDEILPEINEEGEFFLGVGSSLYAYSQKEVEELAHTRPAPALDPSKFQPFRLVRRERISPDSCRLTFALPRENDELGLSVASLVLVQGPELDDGECAHSFAVRIEVVNRGFCPPSRREAIRSAVHAHVSCARTRPVRASCEELPNREGVKVAGRGAAGHRGSVQGPLCKV